MSGSFKLKWQNRTHGHTFEVDYYFDGCENQKGYSRVGWINHCIAFGKYNGFAYLGMVK